MTESMTSETAITGKPLDPAARIGYVDGLRAIAILMVVFFHGATYAPPVASAWLRQALDEGFHGIELFFVISGFCLSYGVLARVADGKRVFFDFRSYAATRLVRILPPFWIAFALIAVLAAGAVALGHPLAAPPVYPVPSVLDFIRELTLVFPRHGIFISGSFWTLAVEFRWYFAVPFLIALWVRAPRVFFALAVACAVAFAFTQKIFDVASLPAFMLGIVAADAEINCRAWRRWAVAAAIAAIVAAVLFDVRASASLQARTHLPWQLASFFVVVAGGYHAGFRRALGFRALSLIGFASYGIYLIHEPLVAIAEQYFHLPLLGGVAVALATGAAFFYLFERPFVAGPLRDRLRGAIVGALSAPLRPQAKPGITIAANAVTLTETTKGPPRGEPLHDRRPPSYVP
jgi:peptidoglycan/LPS O-acetylase OafA/YrhL